MAVERPPGADGSPVRKPNDDGDVVHVTRLSQVVGERRVWRRGERLRGVVTRLPIFRLEQKQASR
jgi:hypothetical protein